MYNLFEGQTFGDPRYFPPRQRLLSCDTGTRFPDCHHCRESGRQPTCVALLCGSRVDETSVASVLHALAHRHGRVPTRAYASRVRSSVALRGATPLNDAGFFYVNRFYILEPFGISRKIEQEVWRVSPTTPQHPHLRFPRVWRWLEQTSQCQHLGRAAVPAGTLGSRLLANRGSGTPTPRVAGNLCATFGSPRTYPLALY